MTLSTPTDSAGVYAVAGTQKLPLRPKEPAQASVIIHHLPSQDGVIVKVTPPDAPIGRSSTDQMPPHVPCDIALVIDVSGSMGTPAPVPVEKGQQAEDNGLTVLDLVKHAAHTILETLDENDRLGIVTFASRAERLHHLLPMTEANKIKAKAAIASMKPTSATNLWQGMLMGIDLFKQEQLTERVPAVMVLTDGMPNMMSPQQGYIPKMRTMRAPKVPIHTFGFGYGLDSGLLKSIAEFSGGNYAFIPDAGMLGTVFVHAVANIQSTLAVHAKLELTYPEWLQLDQTLGTTVDREEPISSNGGWALTIHLSTIQYGQSREIYLKYRQRDDAVPDTNQFLDAVLTYNSMTNEVHKVSAHSAVDAFDKEDADYVDVDMKPEAANSLSAGEVAFHVSRSALCAYISSLFPLNDECAHHAVTFSDDLVTNLDTWANTLPAALPEHANNASCTALMKDIRGQVRMALSDFQSFRRWGIHYLPSLQSAHAAQQCNSFKDPGPLLYGRGSTLFISCRDALDTAFDNLPAPIPTARHADLPVPMPASVRASSESNVMFARSPGWPAAMPAQAAASAYRSAPIEDGPMAQSPSPRRPVFRMAAYRNSAGPCFASFCRVTLADQRRVQINRLRRGMRVLTPRGPRTVAAVLKTPVRGAAMLSVGRLVITPWHPISHNGARWLFPCHDPSAQDRPSIRYTGSIYSLLLLPDKDAEAHAVSIEGVWVVTLGHGMTESFEDDREKDVRVHKFFGDYGAVCRSMAAMDIRKDGVVVNGGSVRSNFHQWHTRK